MLTLTRKTDEAIMIGHDIRVVVSWIGDGRCKLAIEAPKNVVILRSELMPPDTQCANCKSGIEEGWLCRECETMAAEVKEGW